MVLAFRDGRGAVVAIIVRRASLSLPVELQAADSIPWCRQQAAKSRNRLGHLDKERWLKIAETGCMAKEADVDPRTNSYDSYDS